MKKYNDAPALAPVSDLNQQSSPLIPREAASREFRTINSIKNNLATREEQSIIQAYFKGRSS